MSKGQRRRLKKPIRIGLAVCGVILFVLLIVLASNYQSNRPIKGYRLEMSNPSAENIFEKDRIDAEIKGNPDLQVAGKTRKELDLSLIERVVRADPWVAKTEVFVDNNDWVKIKVTERVPIAQLFEVNGKAIYMDSTLSQMPAQIGRSFSTPVFTNVIFIKNDSMNRALSQKIGYLAERIGRDSFWNAQIQQIVVQPDQSFVMVPLLGNNQRIIFGDTSRTEEKLFNLMSFYKQVSARNGWDLYQKLDLRFKGQVVASPTLGVTLAKQKKTNDINELTD